MGGGSWTSDKFKTYSMSKSRGIDSTGRAILSDDVTQNYTQRGLAKELNPFCQKRECRDSEEHPNTIPVILALDVTTSMVVTHCNEYMNDYLIDAANDQHLNLYVSYDETNIRKV